MDEKTEKKDTLVILGENSLAASLNEGLKDSGKEALERHAKFGLPIVISNDKGETVYKYIDGRIEKKKPIAK
jgi:hypothetical protein